MNQEKGLSISECFADLPDPRMEKKTSHKLIDIITITICAVISGANGWTKVEEYGNAKYDWLKTFLELPHGIPSHDTFGRFFSLLATDELEKCFLRWIQSVAEALEGYIAIDGKQLRRWNLIWDFIDLERSYLVCAWGGCYSHQAKAKSYWREE